MRIEKKLSALFIAIILSAAFLFACSGDAGSDDTVTDTDSSEAEEASNSIKANDTIYIPIEKSTASSDIPVSSLTEQELDAAVLKQSRDMGIEYIDKITFICDYVSYGIKAYGMLSEGRETERVLTGIGASFSFCGSADNLIYHARDDTLKTVGDAISEIKPEICVIAAGGDDVARNVSMNSFRSGIIALIEEIRSVSPDTVVILVSVLPGSHSSDIGIYDVEKYNKYMLEAAAEHGAYYIDAASAFAASNGYLREDCDGGESRLNTVGIKSLLDFIRTHAYQASQPVS